MSNQIHFPVDARPSFSVTDLYVFTLTFRSPKAFYTPKNCLSRRCIFWGSDHNELSVLLSYLLFAFKVYIVWPFCIFGHKKCYKIDHNNEHCFTRNEDALHFIEIIMNPRSRFGELIWSLSFESLNTIQWSWCVCFGWLINIKGIETRYDTS